MFEMVEENILVVASDGSDRALMEALLTRSGIRKPHGDASREPPRETELPRTLIVCHRATATSPAPTLPMPCDAARVIVFSDCQSEPAVVHALEAGAHYYFDIGEAPAVLGARLAAALRSHSRHVQRQLVVPPFRFDLAKRRAWREERPVGLSPKEFDLAFYLFSNRGRTVGNRELMTAVWSLPRSMDSRRIDTAACRVRKKMLLDETEGLHLRRLRGEGYLLTSDTRVVPRVPGADGSDDLYYAEAYA